MATSICKGDRKRAFGFMLWHGTSLQYSFLERSHGRRSLVGCSPWGREELDTTERLHFHFSLSCIGEGNGNPLQCSCLENPRDGGSWWAAIYGVTQSRTWLKQLSSSSSSTSRTLCHKLFACCLVPPVQCKLPEGRAWSSGLTACAHPVPRAKPTSCKHLCEWINVHRQVVPSSFQPYKQHTQQAPLKKEQPGTEDTFPFSSNILFW